jgi:hypothetical protein
MQRIRLVFALALTLVLSTGALTLAKADPECKKNKDGFCIALFDPVICKNNKIYSNACFAALDCAKECQPFTEPAS